MLRRLASLHNAANVTPGRSQLFSQAFQASCSLSSSKPGSSAQRTGIQRLLTWLMAGGSGALSSALPTLKEGDVLGDGADTGGTDVTGACGSCVTAQDAKSIPLAIIMTLCDIF